MPPNAASPDAPLSHAQLQELAAARARAAKIRRAAGVAAFSGWSMAAFAALTLLGGLLFFSPVGLILGGGLGAIAFTELRGRSLLLRYRTSAPMILALNQLALGILIMAYAAWSLYQGLTAPISDQLQTGDPQADATVIRLVHTVTVALYGSVALYALIVPGLTAWYYLSRAGHLRRFLNDTPPWVLQVLRL